MHKILKLLSQTYGRAAGANFSFVGWEDIAACRSKRNQDKINALIQSCDAFVLLFHKRWGQPTGDDDPYSSFTEEEYHEAIKLFDKTGKPSICILFKSVSKRDAANPDPQLKRVLDFKSALRQERQTFSKEFRTVMDLQTQVYLHLVAEDEGREIAVVAGSKFTETALATLGQLSTNAERQYEEIERSESSGSEETLEARETAHTLALVHAAGKLAAAGFTDDAKRAFDVAIPMCKSSKALFLISDFYLQLGNFERVIELVSRAKKYSTPQDVWHTAVHSLITEGNVAVRQGELDRAKTLYLDAAIEAKASGDGALITATLGSIAIPQEMAGDIEAAMASVTTAISLSREFEYRTYLAVGLGTLGILQRKRGKIAEAKSAFEESRRIGEELGNLQIVADATGNLSTLLQNEGNYAEAEAKLRECLTIEIKLQRPHGQATACTNLGVLFATQELWPEAVTYFTDALNIASQFGLGGQEIDAHTFLAAVHNSQQRYDLAKPHVHAAFRLRSKLKLEFTEGQNKRLIAIRLSRTSADGTIRPA